MSPLGISPVNWVERNSSGRAPGCECRIPEPRARRGGPQRLRSRPCARSLPVPLDAISSFRQDTPPTVLPTTSRSVPPPRRPPASPRVSDCRRSKPKERGRSETGLPGSIPGRSRHSRAAASAPTSLPPLTVPQRVRFGRAPRRTGRIDPLGARPLRQRTPGGRSAAVQVPRTASHERSPPPRLRSDRRPLAPGTGRGKASWHLPVTSSS
jgi:hypothetical protein